MADPAGGDLVEAHLDDELRAQLVDLELLVGLPAARLARDHPAGGVRGELLDELALALGGEARAVADRPQLAVLRVQAEDERADGPLLLAVAPALHDGVDRPLALDLHHALALAGQVRRVELLGDHALGVLQPALGLLGRADRGGQRDARVGERVPGEEPLERVAAGREGALDQRRVAGGEQVEGDVAGRHLLRQLGDARRRGMDALRQRVEVGGGVAIEAFGVDDDLPVEDVPAGREPELGEVALQRLAAAGEEDERRAPGGRRRAVVRAEAVRPADGRLGVHERDCPEPVPLGLVRPAVAGGQARLPAGELRGERGLQRQRHGGATLPAGGRGDAGPGGGARRGVGARRGPAAGGPRLGGESRAGGRRGSAARPRVGGQREQHRRAHLFQPYAAGAS